MQPSNLVYEKVPEVTMRIKLRDERGEEGIPAGFLIRQAREAHIPLSPGVVERAGSMPSEPAIIPPAPLPVDKRDTTPPPDEHRIP